MKFFGVIVTVLLAGCAVDQYHSLPGVSADQQVVLHQCKVEALHAHFKDESSVPGVIGGLVGGAIGGALAGVLTPPQSDINVDIAACMHSHGFEGHSEG